MAMTAGAKPGPYQILAPIGAGGMGEVYRARDAKLKRHVALKVLPETFAGDPDRMARFLREAQVLASLNQRRTGINPVNREQWWRYRLPGFGSIAWPAFLTILMDAGYQGAMNIEHEDALYGWPYASDEFSDIYKDGFRIGLQYLRQYLPASALQTRG